MFRKLAAAYRSSLLRSLAASPAALSLPYCPAPASYLASIAEPHRSVLMCCQQLLKQPRQLCTANCQPCQALRRQAALQRMWMPSYMALGPLRLQTCSRQNSQILRPSMAAMQHLGVVHLSCRLVQHCRRRWPPLHPRSARSWQAAARTPLSSRCRCRPAWR